MKPRYVSPLGPIDQFDRPSAFGPRPADRAEDDVVRFEAAQRAARRTRLIAIAFGLGVLVTGALTALGCGASALPSAHPDPRKTSAQARMTELPDGPGACLPGMVEIEGHFCIDRFEASTVEILPSGDEQPWSPFEPVDGRTVRAVSVAHAFPQGYISAVQAEQACQRSHKRLCKPQEWKLACMGPTKLVWGYGSFRQPGRCNDTGRSPVRAMFGFSADAWSSKRMNDPQLNQLDGTLARTGEHEGCTNEYGVYDMVGNLHEWVADPDGTFNGGYYQDVELNGDGCNYATVAHGAAYHDYSTGFRCCADFELE